MPSMHTTARPSMLFRIPLHPPAPAPAPVALPAYKKVRRARVSQQCECACTFLRVYSPHDVAAILAGIKMTTKMMNGLLATFIYLYIEEIEIEEYHINVYQIW